MMNDEYSDIMIDSIDDFLSIQYGSIVYLYGSGAAGSRVRYGLSKVRPDLNIHGFIDSYQSGTKDNLPVISLDNFLSNKIKYDLILITSSYFPEIVPALQTKKITRFKIVDIYFIDFAQDRWIFSGKKTVDILALFEGNEQKFAFNVDGVFPDMDLRLTALGRDAIGYVCYLFDFGSKIIRRWKIPYLTPSKAVDMVKAKIHRSLLRPIYQGKQSDRMMIHISASKYVDIQMRPHVCHCSETGYLFAPTWNGFTNFIINMSNGNLRIFPDSFNNIMMYSATNCFSKDQEWVYFVKWKLSDSINNVINKTDHADCYLCKVRLKDLHEVELYRMEYSEEVHQITCTPDERYVVFTTFKHDVRVPYPLSLIEDDIAGYRRSHESGIPLKEMVTVDLQTKQHWTTRIPTPVPAHFEFDPIDPCVFYVSTHNCIFHGTAYVNAPILEGPGTIHRVRICDRKTVVEASYSDAEFLRIFQHIPFVYKGKTYIAVATTPNKLDIIDASSMKMFRRVKLFESEQPDFSQTGSAPAPFGRHHYNCVNPSRDGRYIVLGSMQDFIVFDMQEDRLLNSRLYIPNLDGGDNMIGHTRTAGF